MTLTIYWSSLRIMNLLGIFCCPVILFFLDGTDKSSYLKRESYTCSILLQIYIYSIIKKPTFSSELYSERLNSEPSSKQANLGAMSNSIN